MLAVYPSFALAASTVVSSGRGAGRYEELGQTVCSFLAPGAVNPWFIQWVIRPLQVVHQLVGHPLGRQFARMDDVDEAEPSK